MAASFTPVTLSQFQSIFQTDKGWKIERKSDELLITRDFTMFEKISPFWGKNIKFIVYTGISASESTSRNCGKDAIRFVVVKSFLKDGKIIEYAFLKKQPRVYRSTASGNPMDVIDRCKSACQNLIELVKEEIKSKKLSHKN